MSDRRFSFTEARLKSIQPPESGRQSYHDTGSPLELRVTATGAMTFSLRRRIDGKAVRVRIGEWPGLTVARARKLAEETLGNIRRGANPNVERRARREAVTAESYTVGHAVADYIDDSAKGVRLAKGGKRVKPSTIEDYRKREPLLEPLAEKPAAELDALDLDYLKRTNKPSVAAHAIKLLRASVTYAFGRGVLKVNFFAGRQGDVVTLPKRETYVHERDVGRLLVELDRLATDDQATPTEQLGADALTLMLVYGFRKNEALTLPAADVDLKAGEVKIRETKNSVTLTVPVTPFTRPLLKRRLDFARQLGSDRLFPTVATKRSAGGHLTDPDPAITKAEASTGLAFTCHDLRRSYGSFAAKRLPHAMLKATMNHRARRHDDVTLNYVQVDAEDLREPLTRLHADLAKLKAAAKRKRGG